MMVIIQQKTLMILDLPMKNKQMKEHSKGVPFFGDVFWKI
jgi:hypothetical protein